MKRLSLFAGLSLMALVLAQPQQASAQNLPPPLGPILDLAGNPIPDVYTNYTVNFTASQSTTDITFAFRNDPGWIVMDDVTATDLTTPAGNVMTNGGFETGDLTGWTYDNVYGVAFSGSVQGAGTCQDGLGPRSGTSEWCDGATQGYDAIDQIIATTVGDTYQVSFWLNAADSTGFYPPSGNFQALSDNGNPGTSGDGLDVLVYAQAGIPPPGTPEPVSMILFGTGLAGICLLRRYGKAKA